MTYYAPKNYEDVPLSVGRKPTRAPGTVGNVSASHPTGDERPDPHCVGCQLVWYQLLGERANLKRQAARAGGQMQRRQRVAAHTLQEIAAAKANIQQLQQRLNNHPDHS